MGIGLEKVHRAGPSCASQDGLTIVKSTAGLTRHLGKGNHLTFDPDLRTTNHLLEGDIFRRALMEERRRRVNKHVLRNINSQIFNPTR
jgi:hypothetical protein